MRTMLSGQGGNAGIHVETCYDITSILKVGYSLVTAVAAQEKIRTFDKLI